MIEYLFILKGLWLQNYVHLTTKNNASEEGEESQPTKID